MPNDAVKYDNGKPRVDLITRDFVEGMGRVLSFGGQKYGFQNWRKGMLWTRPAASALRHLFAWLSGEKLDPESKLPHLHHAACCLMFLSTYEEYGIGTDDRYEMPKKRKPLRPQEEPPMGLGVLAHAENNERVARIGTYAMKYAPKSYLAAATPMSPQHHKPGPDAEFTVEHVILALKQRGSVHDVALRLGCSYGHAARLLRQVRKMPGLIIVKENVDNRRGRPTPYYTITDKR